jgi:hypothetical protein
VHRCGDEAAWWRKVGADPTVVARALWLESHPLPTGPKQLSADAEDSLAAVGIDRTKVQSGRPAGVRRVSRKRNSVKEKTLHGVASDVGS